MRTPNLAEDKRFTLESDETIAAMSHESNPPYGEVGTYDDPMEILMAKQEMERAELECELALSIH